MAANRWWKHDDQEPEPDFPPLSADHPARRIVQPVPERRPATPPAMPSYAPSVVQAPAPEPVVVEPEPETVGARPRALVERLCEKIAAALQTPEYAGRRSQEWDGAILSTYMWALGKRHETPILKRHFSGIPTIQDLGREQRLAQDVTEREVPWPGGNLTQGWVSAVEQSLMWLKGDDRANPWMGGMPS